MSSTDASPLDLSAAGGGIVQHSPPVFPGGFPAEEFFDRQKCGLAAPSFDSANQDARVNDAGSALQTAGLSHLSPSLPDEDQSQPTQPTNLEWLGLGDQLSDLHSFIPMATEAVMAMRRRKVRADELRLRKFISRRFGLVGPDISDKLSRLVDLGVLTQISYSDGYGYRLNPVYYGDQAAGRSRGVPLTGPGSPNCSICGQNSKMVLNGQNERMLECGQCRTFAHPSCLSLSDELVRRIRASAGGYLCVNCKTCKVCSSASDEESIVVCEECDNAYHRRCHSPPIVHKPKGKWTCSACIAELEAPYNPRRGLGDSNGASSVNSSPTPADGQFTTGDTATLNGIGVDADDNRDESELLDLALNAKSNTADSPSSTSGGSPPTVVKAAPPPGIMGLSSLNGCGGGGRLKHPRKRPHPLPLSDPSGNETFQQRAAKRSPVAGTGTAAPGAANQSEPSPRAISTGHHLPTPPTSSPVPGAVHHSHKHRSGAALVNGRSLRWSVNEVFNWARGVLGLQEAHSLRQHEIDGVALLLLTRQDIVQCLNLPLGRALKLHMHIANLQRSYSRSGHVHFG